MLKSNSLFVTSIIGALLGHTQAQTTMRYAHLYDDPLREATSRAGRLLSGVGDRR